MNQQHDPIVPASAPDPSEQALDHVPEAPLGPVGAEPTPEVSFDPFGGTLEPRRKIKTGTILLLLVIVIGGGGLWAMRTVAHVGAAEAGSTDTDTTLDRYLAQQQDGADTARNDTDVLRVLGEDYGERTVALTELAHQNPFALDGSDDQNQTTPTNPEATWSELQAERVTAIKAAGAKMVLKSVMTGFNSLANIDGHIVRLGETFTTDLEGVDFRLTTVEDNRVTLVAEDARFDVFLEIELTIQ